MNIKRILKMSLLSATVIALAGCSSMRSSSMGSEGVSDGAYDQTQGMGSMDHFSGEALYDGEGMPLRGQYSDEIFNALAQMKKKIYFGFDQYNLDTEGQDVAKNNAYFLIKHPNVTAMIAGHTDPRGSQEYNLNLGQRRADAVKNFLLAQGVSGRQICTVSFGEQQLAASPSDFGGDYEKAYALDRRAVIEYGKTCQGAN